jgi:hypothetical protein
MRKFWIYLGIFLLSIVLIVFANQQWKVYKLKKHAELSIRKLALSIRLEKGKQEKITEFEIERLELLKDAKAESRKKPKEFASKAKVINQEFLDKVYPLLDSLQTIKYKKYRAAAMRKRLAKMDFKKLLKGAPRSN